MPTKKVPRSRMLFGRLAPESHSDAETTWRTESGWGATVRKAGSAWSASTAGRSVGNAYSSWAAAKKGIERELVRRVEQSREEALAFGWEPGK